RSIALAATLPRSPAPGGYRRRENPREPEVDPEGADEARETRFVVGSEHEAGDPSGIQPPDLNEKPRNIQKDGERQSHQRAGIEAAPVTVDAVVRIERGDLEVALPNDEIVRDHDRRDRAEQRAVADQPGKDIAARI